MDSSTNIRGNWDRMEKNEKVWPYEVNLKILSETTMEISIKVDLPVGVLIVPGIGVIVALTDQIGLDQDPELPFWMETNQSWSPIMDNPRYKRHQTHHNNHHSRFMYLRNRHNHFTRRLNHLSNHLRQLTMLQVGRNSRRKTITCRPLLQPTTFRTHPAARLGLRPVL